MQDTNFNNTNNREYVSKVSVIIPVYNAEGYLDECLRSVLSQTLQELDIVCINDGSTDDSEAILYQYAVKDRRIRIVSQKNGGVAAARNRGIDMAAGQYIVFLDPDDYYPAPDVLQNLYTAAEVNGVAVSGGSFSKVSDGVVLTKFDGEEAQYTFHKDGLVRFCDYQFDYGFHRFMYNTAFLRSNHLRFPPYLRYQDPPFLARALAAAKTFYAIRSVTYVYRIGHRCVEWTVRKVCDFLSGVRDNLEFSSKYGYAYLHYLNWQRINSKFYTNIILRTVRYDRGGEIVKRLVALQTSFDKKLLAKQIPSGDWYVCEPLNCMLEGWLKQDRRLHDEGWFINRKVFRLYTWPVRCMGRVLRRWKNRRRTKNH